MHEGNRPAVERVPEYRLWNPFILCLAGLVAASWALLLALETQVTFFADEWAFILDRRGWSVGDFLDPHNDHIALAPVSLYRLLLGIFGMDSAFPFQVASTLVFLLSATLLFAYLRRRVGDWPALLGSALILFLGASWIDLLWPFQIAFSASIAAGLGALLALDRDDREGDWIACALLVVSTSFSELGVPFIAGALVSVLLGGRPRIGRLYVALVPIALYALWWLGWGHTAESALSADNVLTSPAFVFDAASQAMASLLGLATPLTGSGLNPVGLNWGRILLVIGIGLAVWRFWGPGEVPRPVWVVLAIGGSFWFLTAFNEVPGFREPTSPRYQYPGAVFLLLIAAEVLRGVRINTRALALGSALTALAVLSGLWALHLGHSNFLKPMSEGLRARLAAIEIAQDHLEPGFYVVSLLGQIDAATYLTLVDADGSPAYSESELASATVAARAGADNAIVRGLGVGLGNGSGSPAEGQGECQTVAATPTGATGLTLGPGEVTLRARPEASAEVLLARFGDGFPVSLGPLEPGSAASVELPPDRSTQPWRLGLRGAGRVTVCPTSIVSEPSASDEDGGTSPLVPILIVVGAVGLLAGGAWWASREPVPISTPPPTA